MLWLVQRLFYGPESELAVSRPPVDLGLGEQAMLWPLAVLMLVMGLAPSLWIPAIENRVGAPVLRGMTALPEASLSVALHGEGQR
jgi:NADH-quinone oxidoreductase subunit M